MGGSFVSGAVPADVETRQSGKLYRIGRLTYRTGNHSQADAVVYVPPGFDPAAPLELIVFNHGLTTGCEDTWSIWQFDSHVIHMPDACVLVLPEWARNPRAYSQEAGPFHEPGFFRKMLQEILSRVPETRDLKVDELAALHIMTFSGGWKASMTEIYANSLEEKVRSLTLFDSLYRASAFDTWLADNLEALAGGDKQYRNFYFDTQTNSRAQLAFLEQMLAKKGIEKGSVFVEPELPTKVMSVEEIMSNPVVFKHTTLATPHYIAHRQVVSTYLPLVLQSLNRAEAAQASR